MLETETRAHREVRAAGYARTAKGRRAAARAEGMSERDVAQAALWHASRATGQRERFDNVRGCGQGKTMTVLCTSCGVVSARPMHCGHGIVCSDCRARKIHKRRGRIGRARAVVLQLAAKAGLLWRKRAGGRHSEKLLTLTIPHVAAHGVAERIGYVFRAWPHFLKAMNRWLRDTHESATWLRNAEWTIGQDAQGHPHVHVWILGPFLPHTSERDLVTSWWREALARAGFAAEGGSLGQADALSQLIVDLRQVRNGKIDEAGVVTEIVKYMCKDQVAPGHYVDAETYARVYEAFDVRRAEQGSKGFVGLGTQEVCCPDCDAQRSFLVQVDDGPMRGSIEAHRAHAESRGPPESPPIRHERSEPYARPGSLGDAWDGQDFAAELSGSLRRKADAWLASRPHHVDCRCASCHGARLRALHARSAAKRARESAP